MKINSLNTQKNWIKLSSIYITSFQTIETIITVVHSCIQKKNTIKFSPLLILFPSSQQQYKTPKVVRHIIRNECNCEIYHATSEYIIFFLHQNLCQHSSSCTLCTESHDKKEKKFRVKNLDISVAYMHFKTKKGHVWRIYFPNRKI